MTPNQSVTEPELGTWIVRAGLFVIAFFLSLGVRDAKKSLDEIPMLKATVDNMKESLLTLSRKVERLEGRKEE